MKSGALPTELPALTAIYHRHRNGEEMIPNLERDVNRKIAKSESNAINYASPGLKFVPFQVQWIQ